MRIVQLVFFAVTLNESELQMKRTLLFAAATGALLFSNPAVAQVQGQERDVLQQVLGAVFGSTQQRSEQVLESDWNQGRRPFGQRRVQLDARINMAVREGSLSRSEADQIRSEYDEIVRLEDEYSADGSISQAQRSDLRTRYRALSQRVGGQGYAQNPDQGYGQDNGQSAYQDDKRWQPLSQRSRDFEQRVTLGLRNRNLTQLEATRLRADWQALTQVEASYQRGGIDQREQADLWARYNAIDNRLRSNTGSGSGDRARWSRLETQLAVAERNGSIRPNDVLQVRAQLSDLARLDAAYAISGYSSDESSYLSRRYGEVDELLRYLRR